MRHIRPSNQTRDKDKTGQFKIWVWRNNRLSSTKNIVMETITVKEKCELALFMIANGYSGEEIKDEMAKYIVV